MEDDDSEFFDEELEGTMIVPDTVHRIAFSNHVYRELLNILLGGNSIISCQKTNTGEVLTFRLPPPQHILDFVAFRCTGKRYDGQVEAKVKVFLPSIDHVEEEYLVSELTYVLPDKHWM